MPDESTPAEQPTQEELLARLKALEEENADLTKKLKKKGKADDVAADAPAGDEHDPAAYLEEKVVVNLFKDDDKYKDDVDIAVNGERIIIQRGIDVMVPRKHALILQQSLKADDLTRARIAALVSDYTAKQKALT